MKRSRFTEEQIIGILREQEAGATTAMSVASTGSAARPSTSGRPSIGGLEVSDARRLKALEDENAAEEAVGRGDAGQRHAEGDRLKKMVTPAARREAVAHLVQRSR